MIQPSTRRDAMLAALFAALPAAMAREASASPIDNLQTIIRPPADMVWKGNPAFSEKSVENCVLSGDPTQPGLYFTLVRWWPGFMSAPHHYDTDRYCVVVSGTWWVNSGGDFDPASCVPAAAGSFVHRVAHTPHYDGVIKGHSEPATIAICGIGPVNYQAVDPAQAGVRRL